MNCLHYCLTFALIASIVIASPPSEQQIWKDRFGFTVPIFFCDDRLVVLNTEHGFFSDVEDAKSGSNTHGSSSLTIPFIDELRGMIRTPVNIPGHQYTIHLESSMQDWLLHVIGHPPPLGDAFVAHVETLYRLHSVLRDPTSLVAYHYGGRITSLESDVLDHRLQTDIDYYAGHATHSPILLEPHQHYISLLVFLRGFYHYYGSLTVMSTISVQRNMNPLFPRMNAAILLETINGDRTVNSTRRADISPSMVQYFQLMRAGFTSMDAMIERIPCPYSFFNYVLNRLGDAAQEVVGLNFLATSHARENRYVLHTFPDVRQWSIPISSIVINRLVAGGTNIRWEGYRISPESPSDGLLLRALSRRESAPASGELIIMMTPFNGHFSLSTGHVDIARDMVVLRNRASLTPQYNNPWISYDLPALQEIALHRFPTHLLMILTLREFMGDNIVQCGMLKRYHHDKTSKVPTHIGVE